MPGFNFGKVELKTLVYLSLLASSTTFMVMVMGIDSASAGSSKNTVSGTKVTVAKITVTKIEANVLSHGPCLMYFNDNGVKLELTEQHVGYYCFAPDWQVVTYNARNNLGNAVPYEYWKLNIAGRKAALTDNLTSTNGTYLGLPVRKVERKVLPTDSYVSQAEFIYRDGSDRGDQMTSQSIWETTGYKLQKKQLDFLRWRFDLPTLNGVMLKQIDRFKSGRQRTMFETKKVSQVEIARNQFCYPSGYTKAKSSEVKEEHKKYREAADMFGTLMGD